MNRKRLLRRLLTGSLNVSFSDMVNRHNHINIFWSAEDGGYIADIPDLASCSAFGTTPEEALEQVQIAKQAWLHTALVVCHRGSGVLVPRR